MSESIDWIDVTEMTEMPQSIKSHKGAKFIAQWNSNEFYLFRHQTVASDVAQWGIFKYNSITNKWENVMKYPPKYKGNPDAVTFDEENNKILVWNDTDYYSNPSRGFFDALQRMDYFDMNTFEIDQKQYDDPFRKGTNVMRKKSYCIFDEYHNLHIIGRESRTNKHHLILNKDEDTFIKIDQFEDMNISTISEGIIYLKCRREMLLIDRVYLDGSIKLRMIIYSFKTQKWKMVGGDITINFKLSL